ncbi:MAG: PqqD family protein [Theionarchaea archaeon]|nr:PqqD family protein [Theionarchaea archaeon]MBU7000611.1 PqqD family protein [Theionarchaea archaeon]MBU7022006.1 PqqD family protein [Theionarchaea archaeon]MBU7035959.1 PqqD family protein [Theionarchaea archaeon]MBU7041778.1 PqqD family protein [Theionarchaea archaeon]
MEDLKGRYVRWSEACVWQPFGTSLAILRVLAPDSSPSQESEGIKLNATGKDVWDLCDGTRTVDDIVAQLLEEYQGEPERIQESVETIVLMLQERGFLTCESTPHLYSVREIPLQDYACWNDTIIWNEVEGQVVAMNNSTGVALPIPTEAAEMWKLCNGKTAVEDIFSILKSKGLITQKMPLAKFKLLLKQWIKLNFIILKDEPL